MLLVLYVIVPPAAAADFVQSVLEREPINVTAAYCLCCLRPAAYCLQVRVLYAFDAEAEGELSVAAGDSLWVEAEVDGWYQVVRDGDGSRGLVPTSYVDVEQF
jgi:hypothetical protein